MLEMTNSEKTVLHALSMNVMRSIAGQHGGTIEINALTDTVDVLVPLGQVDICAREMEEQTSGLFRRMCDQAVALFIGEKLVSVCEN